MNNITGNYIDPGTAGMVVSSFWPVVLTAIAAVGAFFVKIFFTPIKNTFNKLFKKE